MAISPARARKGLLNRAVATALRRHVPATALAIAALGASGHAAAEPFPAVFELSTLDGSNGFVIEGVNVNDQLGSDVAAPGDVNGDGVDDVAISARLAKPGGRFFAGETYVLFGTAQAFPAVFDPDQIDGTNGRVYAGIDTNDQSGTSVGAAGDVNGDQLADLIIGAPYADPNGKNSAGESYVVFGNAGVAPRLNFIELTGSNGFALLGNDAVDLSGSAVDGIGDINDDGFDDVIVGAVWGDPGARTDAGESFVVFGAASGLPATLLLSTLDGTNGFVVNGAAAFNNAGRSVSRAGDVNGDGMEDLLVGAPAAAPNGSSSGQSYVVFGRNTLFPAAIEVADLDGSDGFAINGLDGFDRAAIVSDAGDVNGDGIDDILIGARYAAIGEERNAGQSYVIFGRDTGFPAEFELSALDGQNGFSLDGVAEEDLSGFAVASAGDINGDGFDDVLVGAISTDPGGRTLAGSSYVVFGKPDPFPAALALAELDGCNGFALHGIDSFDGAGSAVSSAGDLNDDGADDIVIGAPSATVGANSYAGESYVVFGRTDTDADADGVPDRCDNCTDTANADQRDTDADGIGNQCDADVDVSLDCLVEFADLNLLKLAFFATPGDAEWNPDLDFDGDDEIGFSDLNLMKLSFFSPPGPSAIGCN